MAVSMGEKTAPETDANKVAPLPDLETSNRPQMQIEVGLVPLPAGFKAILYKLFSGRPAGSISQRSRGKTA